jgi:mRNA interferase MazF
MQFEIFWADLDPVIGREQAGRRPVLVVSNDIENRLDIVTIVPVTSRKPGRRIYPNEVLFRLKGREAILLCHQIRTLSKRRLGTSAGRLPDRLQQQVIAVLCRRFERF